MEGIDSIMDDAPVHPDADELSAQTEQRDQLRALTFRMREIQRLLAMRVEQENRRLEADGLEAVTETRFREDAERR